ncbi:predicted protein [Naegleria gruberi]|uniref:Predicted protein n=1 Tax=Naegleria gruberi TaxID=5762 RepID=D2W4Q2_NAEGR|nr:uncharacterized protein NAEGRDRAFT_54657 [Naegleria gruberi]EFC35947.1 predicted protein [Naegleria gruberi]|eukprot:XP_002668691.1 predicted protein [Naegleria gruberi strain NEG-M]
MSYSSDEEDYQEEEEEPFSSSSPSSPSSSSSGDEEEESTDDRYVRVEGNNPKRKNLNVTSNSSSSNMNFIQSNFNDHHYIYPDSDLNYGYFLNTTANRRSSSSGGDKKTGAAAFTFTASGQPFGISGGGLGGGDQTLISSSNSNSFSSSNSTLCGGFKFDDTSKVLCSQQKPIFGSFNTSQPFGTNSGDDHQATNNSNSSNTHNASSTSSLAASEEKLFVFGSVPSSSSSSLSHSPTKTMHRRGINVASKNRNENIDTIFNSLPKPPTFGYQQAVDQKDSTTGDSLTEMKDSDAVVKIPDSLGGVKTIYCHKTVLSSASEMLEVNFGPNWSNEEDEDGRAIINVEHLIEVASDPSVMEFIIEYAYGIFAPIKVSSKQVIPLIKAAHFYRIQGLLDECLYLCVNRDKLSFFEVAESLEDHFEDETMEAFEDVMVEIGTANYPFIIGASDEELMKLPKRMLIKMFRKIYKTYIPNIKTL